jgi:MFS family permease
LNRKALVFLFTTVFLDLLGAGILLPVLPYFVKPFRSDATTVGLLALSFFAAQFFASPILGTLSDRYGRRTILLGSILGSAVGYFMFGIGGSLTILFLARLLDGVTGGNISTAQAYIADVTAPEDRAKGFGLIGVAFGLGFMIGPAAGGALSKISLSAPAIAAGGLALATAAFGYFALPESLPASRRRTQAITLSDLNPFRTLRGALDRPALRFLLVAVFVFNVANSGLHSNFPVFTSARFGYGPDWNGVLLALVGVAAGVTQGLLVRRMVPVYGERNLVFAGLAVATVTFAWIAEAYSGWSLCGALMANAVGVSLAAPSFTGLISQAAEAHEQGVILGAMTSIACLGRVAGPLCAGVAFDALGQGAPYWTAAALMIAGAGFVRKSPASENPERTIAAAAQVTR